MQTLERSGPGTTTTHPALPHRQPALVLRARQDASPEPPPEPDEGREGGGRAEKDGDDEGAADGGVVEVEAHARPVDARVRCFRAGREWRRRRRGGGRGRGARRAAEEAAVAEGEQPDEEVDVGVRLRVEAGSVRELERVGEGERAGTHEAREDARLGGRKRREVARRLALSVLVGCGGAVERPVEGGDGVGVGRQVGRGGEVRHVRDKVEGHAAALRPEVSSCGQTLSRVKRHGKPESEAPEFEFGELGAGREVRQLLPDRDWVVRQQDTPARPTVSR